ncbi:Gtpase activating protein [Coemansia sp. RSA 1807]|nr:Gtpase activating protein [Coemansia sp. RSA 1591]KAJ1769792.1 Gtpase activating protein [Coemansia sp. RSA 1824]KAJ1788058.1 Gtpase activating protein [Coemansia sp. RSA 2167]KAJ2574917.1 Gtpase activating protein [Coemansia sp. RSA 1807]
MVAATDKEKKRLAEKHHKLLAELSKQPANSTCADCGAAGKFIFSRWASWNLGVFLCIRCGGLHRHIGTHISKVKSISLDNWTTEQIEHFSQVGNTRANAYFNPHADRHPAPRSDRDVERYIRDKYERRIFVDRTMGAADPSVVGAKPPVAAQGEASALTRLHELGFTDVRANHAALQKCAMDVDRAAAVLRGESSGVSESDPRVRQLLNMGFASAAQNARALDASDGDVNRAIEVLLGDNAPPRSASASQPPKPPAKSPRVVPNPPANDLLDTDFFASVPAAPAASSKPSGLDDLVGNLSISAAPTTAPAVSAVQESNDLFGDFGDFLSAGPEPLQAPSTAPATSKPVAKPVSPPAHGGQSMMDTSFIMSLYSKPSPSNNPAPTTTNTNNSNSNNSGFNDLDFFM